MQPSFLSDIPNITLSAPATSGSIQPEFPPSFNPNSSNPWSFFQQTAISNDDLALQEKFYAELDNIRLEFCPRCNEKWFNMKIQVGICSKCHQKDDKKAPNEPFYFSAANELDFGNIPANLPELSLTEQMMISKIHVFTQIRQVRGAQYRYRGHCVSFARNVAKVCFFQDFFITHPLFEHYFF